MGTVGVFGGVIVGLILCPIDAGFFDELLGPRLRLKLPDPFSRAVSWRMG